MRAHARAQQRRKRLKHDGNGSVARAETLGVAPLLPMHMRSDAASAAPKAQQQPQSLWSRISSMMLAQWGLRQSAYEYSAAVGL